MRTTRMLLTAVIGIVLLSPVQAQKKLTAAEAKEHIGETATVCGDVVSTRYASSSKGHPTFLNFDKQYPNQIFTVVGAAIEASSKLPRKITKTRRFASPERSLRMMDCRRSSLMIRSKFGLSNRNRCNGRNN